MLVYSLWLEHTGCAVSIKMMYDDDNYDDDFCLNKDDDDYD